MGLSKFRQIKYIIFGTLSFVSTLVFAESNRPAYYGFAPAFPLSTQLPAFEPPLPNVVGERSLTLKLEISEKGEVKNIKPELAQDSAFARYLFSSVGKISFEPALKNGEAVKSLLPVQFTFNPRHRSARVEYPVDSLLHISDGDLYFQAIELSGMTLPRLEKFPSFFGWARSPDSLEALPYVLIKLNINETGNLTNSELHSTNIAAFANQTVAASLWADYSPLIVDNTPTQSQCYLSVLFFPQIKYPTKAVDFKNDSSLNWYDRWKVRLIPDTVSLMHPAIPSSAKFGEMTLVGEEQMLNAVVSVNLIIDSLGNLRVGSTDTKKPELNKAVKNVFRGTRFYPASDYSGTTKFFGGTAKLYFENRGIARVEYLWLEN